MSGGCNPEEPPLSGAFVSVNQPRVSRPLRGSQCRPSQEGCAGSQGGPSTGGQGCTGTAAVGARAQEPQKTLGTRALQAVLPASGMFSAWVLLVSARGREECQGRGSGSPWPPLTPPWGFLQTPHRLGADEPAPWAAYLSTGNQAWAQGAQGSQEARVLKGANASLHGGSWRSLLLLAPPTPGLGGPCRYPPPCV